MLNSRERQTANSIDKKSVEGEAGLRLQRAKPVDVEKSAIESVITSAADVGLVQVGGNSQNQHIDLMTIAGTGAIYPPINVAGIHRIVGDVLIAGIAFGLAHMGPQIEASPVNG